MANIKITDLTAYTSPATTDVLPIVDVGADATKKITFQSLQRYYDSDASHYVAFSAPATVSANLTWTLPAADGTSGQVLSTDGAGVLSWTTGARTTAAAGTLPATSYAAITYAASVALDLAVLDGQYRTISLTGDLTFTTSNLATGRTVVIRIIADASQRTLTFPTDWKFIGTKPANIAASKTGVLSLTFFGSLDSDCFAAWGVQG